MCKEGFKLDHCEHLNDLIKDEIDVLREAYAHRRFLMERDCGIVISEEEAEQDFNKKFMNSYGEAMRLIYCHSVCKDYEKCETGHKFLHYYQDYFENKKKENKK